MVMGAEMEMGTAGAGGNAGWDWVEHGQDRGGEAMGA
jgi:hypothetical protein